MPNEAGEQPASFFSPDLSPQHHPQVLPHHSAQALSLAVDSSHSRHSWLQLSLRVGYTQFHQVEPWRMQPFESRLVRQGRIGLRRIRSDPHRFRIPKPPHTFDLQFSARALLDLVHVYSETKMRARNSSRS